MMIVTVMRKGWGVAGLLAFLILAGAMASDLPETPPASKYAPADDLIGRVDFYLHRAEETLANKADFDAAAKSRLRKDANTLTALFLTLGLHDTNNRYKDASPALVELSQTLAKAADYDAAKETFDDLKKAASGAAPAGAGG